MDLLGDLLTTRPIRTGWKFTIELYPSWRFWCIDNQDRQFRNGSVWTWTWTSSDGPEPLATLFSDSARWPATSAHPCIALTQRGLSSPCIECRFNLILTNCMFGQPNLISENRLCEPISIKSEVRRERIVKAQVKKRQLRRVQLTVSVRQACFPSPAMNQSITI